VTSSDGTTHALDHLREGPPVILVCSGSTGRMVNAPLAALLARRFTVLNYNHRVEATAETRRLLGDAPDPTACWSHSLRPDTQAGRLATMWRVVLQSPVRGRRGQPRRWPVMLVADRGYDFDCYRRALRSRGIRPQIARRGTLHGSGLGRLRWVVERVRHEAP
jgi:hypothetical protein